MKWLPHQLHWATALAVGLSNKGADMRKLITAAAGLAAFALAAPAGASVQINFTGTSGIPSNNDFRSQLNALLLTQYASTGASLVLGSNSVITFELMGTESGFSDQFATLSAPNLSYTEHTTFQNDFGSPISIGSASFSAGSLAGLLNFSAVGGSPQTVGQPGFGIFLPRGAVSGQSFSTFYFAYDDQASNPDRDFDDMIIRATVQSVPEPQTWAMMLVGFAAIGFALRRAGRKVRIPRVA
jgi:hypothetical protein